MTTHRLSARASIRYCARRCAGQCGPSCTSPSAAPARLTWPYKAQRSPEDGSEPVLACLFLGSHAHPDTPRAVTVLWTGSRNQARSTGISSCGPAQLYADGTSWNSGDSGKARSSGRWVTTWTSVSGETGPVADHWMKADLCNVLHVWSRDARSWEATEMLQGYDSTAQWNCVFVCAVWYTRKTRAGLISVKYLLQRKYRLLKSSSE